MSGSVYRFPQSQGILLADTGLKELCHLRWLRNLLQLSPHTRPKEFSLFEIS